MQVSEGEIGLSCQATFSQTHESSFLLSSPEIMAARSNQWMGAVVVPEKPVGFVAVGG